MQTEHQQALAASLSNVTTIPNQVVAPSTVAAIPTNTATAPAPVAAAPTTMPATIPTPVTAPATAVVATIPAPVIASPTTVVATVPAPSPAPAATNAGTTPAIPILHAFSNTASLPKKATPTPTKTRKKQKLLQHGQLAAKPIPTKKCRYTLEHVKRHEKFDPQKHHKPHDASKAQLDYNFAMEYNIVWEDYPEILQKPPRSERKLFNEQSKVTIFKWFIW